MWRLIGQASEAPEHQSRGCLGPKIIEVNINAEKAFKVPCYLSFRIEIVRKVEHLAIDVSPTLLCSDSFSFAAELVLADKTCYDGQGHESYLRRSSKGSRTYE